MKTYKLSDGSELNLVIDTFDHLILINDRSGIYFNEFEDLKLLIKNFPNRKRSRNISIARTNRSIRVNISIINKNILWCEVPIQDFDILKEIILEVEKYIALT